MRILEQDDTFTLEGKQKGESGRTNINYIVQYEKGEPLKDAAFELKDNAGSLIGKYTSDNNGLIAEVFLGQNVDYKLTETGSPETYFSPGDTAQRGDGRR